MDSCDERFRVPAARQHVEPPFPQRHFQQARITRVELRHHARTRQAGGVEFPVFPEMNLGEVAETRIREGREADHAAKQLFTFSIFYLFMLFAVLLGEQLVTKLWFA